MANEANLKPFKKGEDKRRNVTGENAGSKWRSTSALKWLGVKQSQKNPISNKDEVMSQEDIMTLSLIKRAREGDVNAYKAIMDSAYGAPKQEVGFKGNINLTDEPVIFE